MEVSFGKPHRHPWLFCGGVDSKSEPLERSFGILSPSCIHYIPVDKKTLKFGGFRVIGCDVVGCCAIHKCSFYAASLHGCVLSQHPTERLLPVLSICAVCQGHKCRNSAARVKACRKILNKGELIAPTSVHQSAAWLVTRPFYSVQCARECSSSWGQASSG